MARWLLPLLLLALLGGQAASARPVADAPRHCEDHPLPEDDDCDTIKNAQDNCRTISNVEQANTDKGWTPTEPPAPEEPDAVMVAGDDGSGDSEFNGDECDSDDDADGVPDRSDNCQFVRNPSQRRTQDPISGDACISDRDADGVPDGRDNCPGVHNPGQENLDGDGRGDACDSDADGDGVLDAGDNCPRVPNSEQGDADGDGVGTACDPGEVRTPAEPTPGPPAGGDGGARDTTAPTLAIARIGRLRAADLRGRAPIFVRCSDACGLSGRLMLGRRVLAAGTAVLAGPGRTYVFMKPRRGALSAVARLRSRRRATLTVRAVDAAGNRRTVRRLVSVSR